MTRLMLSPIYLLDLLNGKILPLLSVPWRQDDPHLSQPLQLIVGVLVDGVLLQIEALEATKARHHRLQVKLSHIVSPGIDLDEAGHLGQDRGQRHEGVAGDVYPLQLGAVGHLPGQHRDPVIGEIKLLDQTKVDRELGWDLLDEVAGDIEGVEGNILHQEENCIRKLGQLTLAQVEILILLGIITSVNNFDDSFTENLDTSRRPLGLSPVVLLHVGVAEVRTEPHDGQPLLVACPGGDLDLVHVQTVQEVNEEGIIHRLSQEFCSISSPTVFPTEGELIRLLLFALY